ncbi:MAG: hypothetical protein ISR48_02015 [Alphaproteobacteria bacterium]|nr:hypothetical protein [Alphaproteobacteria bacterium]
MPGTDPRGAKVWRTPEGDSVSCLEKIKVLNQNLEEIRQMCQDALEDAILMGCDEAQFRQVINELVERLENPYHKK